MPPVTRDRRHCLFLDLRTVNIPWGAFEGLFEKKSASGAPIDPAKSFFPEGSHKTPTRAAFDTPPYLSILSMHRGPGEAQQGPAWLSFLRLNLASNDA